LKQLEQMTGIGMQQPQTIEERPMDDQIDHIDWSKIPLLLLRMKNLEQQVC